MYKLNCKSILFLICLLSFLNCLSQKNSFYPLFKKLAKEKGVEIPDYVNKKAFVFAPIVKKGEEVTFKMGNEKGEKEYGEKPVHNVTLKKPFEMQSTEFTQLQWILLMGGKNFAEFRDEGEIFNIDGLEVSVAVNRPMENIVWNEAKQVAQKLSELDPEYTYSLPTEAQWEYSAGGGMTTDYFFGDDESDLDKYAWVSEGRTHDVALKKPNTFGLFDIYGNVWEWISDMYDENYYSALDEYIDPKGPSVEKYLKTNPSENEYSILRIIRGGSWNFIGSYCKTWIRSVSYQGKCDNHLGFRLVRTKKEQ